MLFSVRASPFAFTPLFPNFFLSTKKKGSFLLTWNLLSSHSSTTYSTIITFRILRSSFHLLFFSHIYLYKVSLRLLSSSRTARGVNSNQFLPLFFFPFCLWPALAFLFFFLPLLQGRRQERVRTRLWKKKRNKPLLWILLLMRERHTDSHTHTQTHMHREITALKKKIRCSWKQNGRSSSFRASLRIAWMSSLYLPDNNSKITTAKKKRLKKRYSRSLLCFTALLLRRGGKKKVTTKAVLPEA